MAEAKTSPSTSEQAAEAGEQKPVVKPVTIEIKQGQKTGVVRTLQVTAVELGIGIAERVRRKARAIAAVVRAWRPPGRPREFDHGAIAGVAEALIRERGLDASLDALCRRVRNECKNKRPRIRTPSGRQMRKILQPTWDAARADNLYTLGNNSE